MLIDKIQDMVESRVKSIYHDKEATAQAVIVNEHTQQWTIDIPSQKMHTTFFISNKMSRNDNVQFALEIVNENVKIIRKNRKQ